MVGCSTTVSITFSDALNVALISIITFSITALRIMTMITVALRSNSKRKTVSGSQGEDELRCVCVYVSVCT